ncbi:hypothetical protein FGIG_07764 [Fasciola gigantica]|uniref:Uncharacterized protein n=1 Tax=Fasciola gigantica TaxID=46835 RepID=A0A504YVR4_FASGI|nr:hypothetical protein FGIG_07764 [Fasciola gigantica]
MCGARVRLCWPSHRRYTLLPLIDQNTFSLLHDEITEKEVKEEAFSILRGILTPKKITGELGNEFQYHTQKSEGSVQQYSAELKKIAGQALVEYDLSVREKLILHRFIDQETHSRLSNGRQKRSNSWGAAVSEEPARHVQR